MAVKGTQHTKKMMSVAARFAAQGEKIMMYLMNVVQSAEQCLTENA